MPKQLTWAQAIERILDSSPTPLHYTEITERIIAEQLRQSLGATPAATVGAIISASIKHDGAASPYVRVAKGTYTLSRGPAGAPAAATTTPAIPEDEAEEQYAVVSSFAMFWRRELVEWVRTPRLLGIQQIGATPVDFNQQRGIYLLYAGREVIYVGRSTDRALGTRLYEHTLDRLSARWDRFSWFGLLPVSDTGALGQLPAAYDSTKMIPALEAILVEALEPRQNRKRGDDLAVVEYIQQEDPAIQKRRIKAAIDQALDRT
jgi:hypothetical protein